MMKSKQSLVVIFRLVFLCFSSSVSYSQTPKYFNYSVEQGLPSSETYDVIQDSQGFIWIATDRGVVRYNGYEFTVFTTNDGLPTNTVFSMVEDKVGRIWFLSFHSHLAYFYNNKIHSYKFNHILGKHIKGTPNPRSIYFDADSGVYVGYDQHGLIHIDKHGVLKKLSGKEKGVIYSCFAIRKKNTLLYGCTESDASGKKLHFTLDDGQKKKNIFYDPSVIGDVYHITGTLRKSGKYIIATSSNLVEYSPVDGTLELKPASKVIRLYEDKDSCLWLCMLRGGVKKLSPNSSNIEKYQYHLLRHKSVTGVLHDREGGFWFSTLENGIYYFPQFRFLRVNTPMSKTLQEVTTITGDRRHTIFAGYSKGVFEEINETNFKTANNLNKAKDSSYYIYALSYDTASKKLWCAFNKGLGIFSGKQPVKIIKNSFIRTVVNVKKNQFLFYDNNFLNFYDNGKTSILCTTKSPLYVEDICIDNSGNVLLATATGLYMYDPKKKMHQPPNFLSHARVKEIENTGQKILYATLGKGIVIEEKGKFQIIDEEKGLASNFVNSIIEDDDTLWLATTKGISRIILTANKPVINNFDQYNGLPTNEIKKIYKQGSRVWLGTKQGLYYFDANKITINKIGPRVIIDQVRVNEKSANYQSKFASNENNLKFSFYSLDYNKRGDINYRYRLIGYDDKWQYTTNRSVSYLSLPAGEYSFEVQAKNKDNYWSILSSTFSFIIFKSFYQEWWFIFSCLIILIAVAYLVVRKRIATIRHNNKVILLMNEYKGIALASQINPHFIFNSLNSIQSFIMHEDRISAAKYLSSFAKLMRKSLEHSRVDFVSIEDEIELLNNYLTLEQLRFKDKFKYEFIIEKAIDQLNIQIPSMILQPFIENSIKHGLMHKKNNEGIVSVKLFFEDILLKCEIEDNGVGRQGANSVRAENAKHISHGIDITVERIKMYCRNEKMKFFFDVEDKFDSFTKPGGTKVVFYLPYKKLKYEA